MTELETNLTTILNEKNTKIIPNNIKEGIQIFDVIGTYRGTSTAEVQQALTIVHNINGEIV